MPPQLPPIKVHPGPALRLGLVATAGGVATLIGINFSPSLDPQGLAKDPGPFAVTLPTAAVGTTYTYDTAPIQTAGNHPVTIVSAQMDGAPAQVNVSVAPVKVTDPTSSPASTVHVLDAGETPSHQAFPITVDPDASTWALQVTVTTLSSGPTSLPPITVDYTVDGKHRTRTYHADVTVTAVSTGS